MRCYSPRRAGRIRTELVVCRHLPVGRPELFFPISAFGQALEQVEEAKAICARCPVRRQCLAFALRTRQAHGIWGGMTEEERAFIRRPRSRTA